MMENPSQLGGWWVDRSLTDHVSNPDVQIFQGAPTSQVLFCFFVNGFLAITAYACAMPWGEASCLGRFGHAKAVNDNNLTSNQSLESWIGLGESSQHTVDFQACDIL